MASEYWIDEYAKKRPEELTSCATCVVDGYKWRVRKDGTTYCAGRATKVDGTGNTGSK